MENKKGNAKLIKPKSNFTIVPNNILNNVNISWRAKGLFCYLYSKPENWEFRVQNIVSAGKEGRDAVRAALKELEVAGYLTRIAEKDITGAFTGWEWHLQDTPVGQPENPSDRKLVGREAGRTDNQGEINNTIPNNTIHSNTVPNNIKKEEENIINFEDFTGIKLIGQAAKNIYLKWIKEWEFSEEMVLKAGEIGVLYSKNINLQFIDTILLNWYRKEIKTLQQVENLIEQHKKQQKQKKNNVKDNKSYSPGGINSDEFELYSPN